MRYGLGLIVLGLIVGSVGQGNDSPALRELGTVILLAGLVMAARALWQRRHKQRDPRL